MKIGLSLVKGMVCTNMPASVINAEHILNRTLTILSDGVESLKPLQAELCIFESHFRYLPSSHP